MSFKKQKKPILSYKTKQNNLKRGEKKRSREKESYNHNMIILRERKNICKPNSTPSTRKSWKPLSLGSPVRKFIFNFFPFQI